MSILTLPAEVVEHILIFAAAGGFPQAIAAFAQTCKANYSIVYDSPDQHLWREIYLTTFDDPRASGGGPGWGECTSAQDVLEDFDWEDEYQERIWAAEYIRHQADLTYRLSAVRPTDEEVTHMNIRAFDALLSVVGTALPCPPTIVLSFLGGGGGTPHRPSPTYDQYPVFPPLPQAIGRFSSNIVAVGPSDAGGRNFGQAARARNTAWLESTLARGYPPELTAAFSGEKWEGGTAGTSLDAARFREMQAAGQLIACTGFIPIPVPLVAVLPVPAPYIGDGMYMSVERQLKRARRLARQRVYNMRYLSHDRHWGPFLPAERRRKSPVRQRVAEDEELLQPLLALIREATTPPGPDHDHDHEEEQAQSGSAEDDNHSAADEGDGEDDASDSEGDEDDGAQADAEPRSSELRADWAYLAAVRMVVEANLRETVQNAQDLRGLLSLDGLRPGSAPWDCSAYKVPDPPEEGSSSGKGKEKATAPDECEGWDWAGVTGIWQ